MSDYDPNVTDEPTQDQAANDSNFTPNLERVQGHGKGRDLGSNPQFDGRLVPAAPIDRTDIATGQQVRTGHTGGLGEFEEVGEENQQRVYAERDVRAPGTSFTAFTTAVPKGVPVLLLGEDVRRGYVRISNVGTDPVLIGTLGMITGGQGFQLLGGQAFEPQTSATLYAMELSTGVQATCNVSVWCERHD